MVSSLTAIRFRVNDLNDRTAAQSRDGKWRNEHQRGRFVGRLDGCLNAGMDGCSLATRLFQVWQMRGSSSTAKKKQKQLKRQFMVRAICQETGMHYTMVIS